MYRNIYMECYKSAVMEKNDIEFLLCHFNHAYSTMGSILNDIQYAIGRLLSNPGGNSARNSIAEQKVQQIVEKPYEKSKKVIDIYEQQKPVKINQDLRPNVVDKNPYKQQESKSATMQFDEMFKLTSKPKQAPVPPKQPNRPSTQANIVNKNKPQTQGDDILDHLFSKR